jgi:hypothetical protein
MTTTWDVFVEDTDSLLNILREGLGDQFSFIDVLDWLTSVGFVSFQVEIKIWWKYMAWKTLWLMSLNVFCRPCINRLYFEIKLYFRSINKWRRNEILRTRCNHNILWDFMSIRVLHLMKLIISLFYHQWKPRRIWQAICLICGEILS